MWSTPVIARRKSGSPVSPEREIQEFYTGTSLEVWFMCWSFGYFKKSNFGEKAKVENVKRFLWILHNSPQNILSILLMKVKLDNLCGIGNTLEWKMCGMLFGPEDKFGEELGQVYARAEDVNQVCFANLLLLEEPGCHCEPSDIGQYRGRADH